MLVLCSGSSLGAAAAGGESNLDFTSSCTWTEYWAISLHQQSLEDSNPLMVPKSNHMIVSLTWFKLVFQIELRAADGNFLVPKGRFGKYFNNVVKISKENVYEREFLFPTFSQQSSTLFFQNSHRENSFSFPFPFMNVRNNISNLHSRL